MPPFGGSPYSPGAEDRYDYRPGSAITDLILRAGDVRARQQERSGEIWGQTVAGLGQMAGQALGDYQQQKAASERETAWSEYLDSGDWAQNPLEAFKTATSIFGSEKGVQQFEGLMAVHKLAKGEIKDPQKAQEYLGYVARTAAGMSDEMLSKYWPTLRAAGQGAGLGDIGEAYQPEFRPQIENLAKAFNAQKPGEGFTLGPGQVRFGPGGEKIAEGLPEEPPKPIAVGGSLVSPTGEVIYQAPEKPSGPKDERLVQITGPDGVAVWVRESEAVGKPAAQAARGVTGQERTNLGFYNRAKKASEDIAPIENAVSKDAGLASQFQLGYEGVGSNLIKTSEQQAYRQAQRAFTEARLRKESGAAIPKEEYTNDARTYFAQPGDSPAVIEQKRAARAVVLDGLRFSSGRAYDEYYGEPAPKGGDTAAPAIQVGAFKIREKR